MRKAVGLEAHGLLVALLDACASGAVSEQGQDKTLPCKKKIHDEEHEIDRTLTEAVHDWHALFAVLAQVEELRKRLSRADQLEIVASNDRNE